MTASTLLFLLLILACPLLMIFMMRGGHGHGPQSGDSAGCHGPGTQDPDSSPTSVEDLRRQRDELDHLIEEREQAERELTPTVGPRP